MAVIAGVGSACLCRQIRARYPEAVVTTVVVAHVIPAGHVAVYALGTCTFNIFGFAAVDEPLVSRSRIHLMKVMFRRVIDVRAVALETEPVVRLNGFRRVRVMAVAAHHLLLKHPALGE